MRKPRLRIEPTGIPRNPYWFAVKWAGQGYLNAHYPTFRAAMKAIDQRFAAKAAKAKA